ncbi:unnamed protein product, partial [Candidula unifasciata]
EKMINLIKSNYCIYEQDYSTNESLYQVIEDVLNLYIPIFLAFSGILSNLINMLIFWKLGVKDSM